MISEIHPFDSALGGLSLSNGRGHNSAVLVCSRLRHAMAFCGHFPSGLSPACHSMKSKLLTAGLIAAGWLHLGGCNYDIPLTAKPTRNVDARLLGDWVAMDKENPQDEFLHIRQLDDATYVVALDKDIYRVFHSDFADTAFVSVQDLNSANRKYVYYTWRLSADGAQLTLQGVSTKVVPEKTKNRTAIQQLIKDNLQNPALFDKPLTYTRKKPHQS
jgi:hypothetical protein